jgi:hypothetical protein
MNDHAAPAVPTSTDQGASMPETAPAVPLLTVGWDTVIGSRQVGYDDETGPEDEPIFLGQLVVDALASQLLGQVQAEADRIRRDALAEVRAEVHRVRAEVAREEITAIVRETLSGEVIPTDPFGYRTGEPTNLRALIVKDVQDYLREPAPRDRYSSGREGGFRLLLKAEVDEALAKELADTIRAARKDVAARVKDRAAEIIGSVVERETR